MWTVHYSNNSGCCRRSVAPRITVLSRHTVFTKRVIYYKFTFVRYSAKQGTMHRPLHHIWHSVCPSFARGKNTDGSVAGLVISLASVCYGDFCWGLLLLLSSFFFLLLLKIVVRSLAFTPDSELVSATRISLMASSSSFIFFPAMAPRHTIVCLVNTVYDWPELQKHT